MLVLAAIALVKVAVMPLFPGFGPDVGSYQSWAGQIASLGPAHTYQEGYFLDYPPGYLYALWVAGLISNAIGASGDFSRIIIEGPAIVADFALAILIYAFVWRSGRAAMAMIAMLLVALNPALLFDTVVWGQSDRCWTFVTLLSLVANPCRAIRNRLGPRGNRRVGQTARVDAPAGARAMDDARIRLSRPGSDPASG